MAGISGSVRWLSSAAASRGLFAARMLARAPVQSLANLTKHNIGQLTALVKTRLRRMQYRAGLLDGFLAKTELDLGNPHN